MEGHRFIPAEMTLRSDRLSPLGHAFSCIASEADEKNRTSVAKANPHPMLCGTAKPVSFYSRTFRSL
jgi:hypothetical protein